MVKKLCENKCECGKICAIGSIYCKKCQNEIIKRNEEITGIDTRKLSSFSFIGKHPQM